MKNQITTNSESAINKMSKNVIVILFLLLNFVVFTTQIDSVDFSDSEKQETVIADGNILLDIPNDSSLSQNEIKEKDVGGILLK